MSRLLPEGVAKLARAGRRRPVAEPRARQFERSRRAELPEGVPSAGSGIPLFFSGMKPEHGYPVGSCAAKRGKPAEIVFKGQATQPALPPTQAADERAPSERGSVAEPPGEAKRGMLCRHSSIASRSPNAAPRGAKA